MMIPFVKMHGLGNDYLFIDVDDAVGLDPCASAARWCDRHRGVGGDGIVLHGPPRDPGNHASMRVVNADGSDGGVCGNGLRCLGLLLAGGKFFDEACIAVETPAGVVRLVVGPIAGDAPRIVEAEMSAPRLEMAAIPAVIPGLDSRDSMIGRQVTELTNLGFEADDLPSESCLSLVSMGNPHAVVRLPEGREHHELDRIIRRIGPRLECHPWFPNRINVHLMSVASPGRIRLSTWERGSGPTRACATGACAAAVAARIPAPESHALEWQVVELPGGPIEIGWDGRLESPVRQRGPAVESFRGVIRTNRGVVSELDSGENERR